MARQKIVIQPEPEIYSMSRQVSFWMWFFFLAVFPIAGMAWHCFRTGDPWDSAWLLTSALVFLFAAKSFEQQRHVKIELTPAGIARIEADGNRTFLKWAEIILSRESQTGRGLVLSSRDGLREIAVDNSLRTFGVLLEKVFEKLRKRMEAPRLPMVFSKVFRSILVEEKGITFRGFFKTRFLAWDEVERMAWSYCYLPGIAGRDLFLKLVLKTGRTIRIRPRFDVFGEMFLVIKKTFGKFGRPKRSNAAELAVAVLAQKRQWLRPFAAGALLITFPGWFLGKILYRIEDSSAWLLFGFFLILACLYLLLSLLFLKEARAVEAPVSEEESSKFRAFATNLSFVFAGFFLTGYFWWFTGKIALNHVKAEVVKAGYSLKMPENAPKLPDEKNAVSYIQKAVKVPSAETLFYVDEKDKKPSYEKSYYEKDNENLFLGRFCRDMLAGRLTKGEIAAAAKLVKEHEETLRLLDKAYEVKNVDWGIDFQAGIGKVEFPHIGYAIPLARLLACEAYLQAKAGKDQEAIKSLLKGFFLADSMAKTKSFIGEEENVAINKIILHSAKDVLLRVDARDAKAKLLPVIDECAKKINLLKGLQFDLFIDPAWMEKIGWGTFAKFMSEDTWRLPCKSRSLKFLFGIFYRPFLPFDLSASYEANLKSMAVYRLPYTKIASASYKSYEESRHKIWFLGWYPLRFSQFVFRSWETVACCNVARAAVETRIFVWQNKRWPKSIQELAGKGEPFLDPFADGADLRFEPKKDGILIYSIGWDGKDNAGTPQIYNMSSGDIGWLVKLPVLTPKQGPSGTLQDTAAKAENPKPAVDVIPPP